MCGRSFVKHEYVVGSRRHGVRGGFFGLDAEKMSPRAQVVTALAVLAPVALTGVVLAFTPVWWIFTTYFWISFPAVGLLARGVAGSVQAGEARPARDSVKDSERDLLLALRRHGELTPAGAASETSLSVAEAERRLRELAESGHLDVRVRGGGIFYALWEGAPEAGERMELG